METENRVIEKHVYEEGKHEYASKNLASTALGFGIGGAVLGAAALWGRHNGLFGNNMPENVNINTLGGASGVAPTAFEVYSNECKDVLDLTREIFGSKINTLNQMYAHRDTDINEKFYLYKSQIDADFGLYKSTRDGFDALTAKHNADTFALYKGQRDADDVLANRISELEKKVAVNEAVRPYQDKLIQCEIERAYTAGINYTDRKTCRMITGQVVLPSTPTVTGYGSYCCCPSTSTSSGSAQ